MLYDLILIVLLILIMFLLVLYADSRSRVKTLQIMLERHERTNAQLYREIALYQRTLPEYVVRGIEKKARG